MYVDGMSCFRSRAIRSNNGVVGAITMCYLDSVYVHNILC